VTKYLTYKVAYPKAYHFQTFLKCQFDHSLISKFILHILRNDLIQDTIFKL